MNNHPYHHSFAVEEGFRRASREIERKQLLQAVKGHNTGRRNSLDAWAGRTRGSIKKGSGDAQAWWGKSTKPQEEGC
jgi:hypothetical protein